MYQWHDWACLFARYDGNREVQSSTPPNGDLLRAELCCIVSNMLASASMPDVTIVFDIDTYFILIHCLRSQIFVLSDG